MRPGTGHTFVILASANTNGRVKSSGHPQLYTEFEASLGCKKPSLNINIQLSLPLRQTQRQNEFTEYHHTRLKGEQFPYSSTSVVCLLFGL